MNTHNWLDWAERENLAPEIIAFIKRNPNSLKECGGRSWETLSKLIGSADIETLAVFFLGERANQFVKFYKDVNTIEAILNSNGVDLYKPLQVLYLGKWTDCDLGMVCPNKVGVYCGPDEEMAHVWIKREHIKTLRNTPPMWTEETLRAELIEELSKNNPDFLKVRLIGQYALKGLYLGEEEWQVKKDERGIYVLLTPGNKVIDEPDKNSEG